MKTKTLALIAVILIFAGKAERLYGFQSFRIPVPLTEAEVINGLKEALITGARNSANKLSVENGYFGDASVKIFLPEEAKIMVNNISKIPGGDKLVQDVILRINRAAEDAAKEAAPVFVNSVKQMTIKDALNILNGADNATTEFLRKTTSNELYSLYKPKIQASTQKKIVGGVSTKDSWVTLTGKWNSFASSVAGKIAGMKTVNTDLDDFLTKKALSGLFLKIEQEELKIRKNTSARTTPLIQKVFGNLAGEIK
jgi:hypothetical protein